MKKRTPENRNDPVDLVQFDEETRKKKGHGFFWKGQEYIHHSTLKHTETALYNLMRHQKLILAAMGGAIVLGLIVSWHATIVALIAIVTFLYFADLLFTFFLIVSGLSRKGAIEISPEAIAAVPDSDWPSYTIFCPLYKEWQVAPQFVKAMSALEYPQDKLQIMFLLEENDKETIENIRNQAMPKNFEIVVVPHSKPKTKPKAMNYGLKFATGEYLVIYDAEDVPDPLQLKKAVLAFKQSSPNTVCIQGKLNFYNPYQNILTRAFTAEYSLWFDLVLPGLQSINAPIPLGGTSNHFKSAMLRELEGWDAFNVTEDCDLGLRLAKRGYRTRIVDSTTFEEATSRIGNWHNQRSRWIKGYIQTYFVHMRSPKQFLETGNVKDFAAFQLSVGAKILSMFINPLMWAITIFYFLFRARYGAVIESFFPNIVLYVGVFSLVFGNFLYLYNYMIGCAKRGYGSIVKYVFIVPVYWLLMSVASWKALYEVVVKPHYWAKTVHGFHLPAVKKIKNSLEQALPVGGLGFREAEGSAAN
jgi:cellulose synthase/poly-beta-1,6-N-acetylglucosamine synthase-like glycosyltransferase